MGAPRYSQQDKDRALQALMASAVEQGGEWVPNFRRLTKEPDMPSFGTLRRWWAARDVTQDGSLRLPLQRAREQVAHEGALDWYRAQVESCRNVVTYILDPEHRIGDERLRADHMARALKDVWPVIKDIQGALDGKQSRDHAAKVARLRQRVKRVGLSTPATTKAAK
jgi:hypothetical protein